MACETRSLTRLTSARIGDTRGGAASAWRRPNLTIHILRMACGEVFDIVALNVAEIGPERVEQPIGTRLNPHVEKPEFRRTARE
jgi:hypothetical protein